MAKRTINCPKANLTKVKYEAMFTQQRLIENGYDVFGFSCSVCTVYIAPFCQRKLIKPMECGRGILMRAHWHALVRTRRQRKRKFFSIDVVVVLLLASSTSMKVEVHWYQKRVFVSSVYTCVLTRFSCLRFSSLHFCERFCLETFQLSDLARFQSISCKRNSDQ